MEKYFLYLFMVPVFWFLFLLSYQIINLIYLWGKDKIFTIKEKEFQLWD